MNIALARAQGREQLFQWESWSKEVFDRAQREHKLLLVDGAAEWCHWCHVMDETTYRDPEVGRVLREKFIAIRVDVDERPDIADRYADYGWPATVILSSDAQELGKFRGYLPPERLREILTTVTTQSAQKEAPPSGPRAPAPSSDALSWIAARTARDMDAFYDSDEGGWGARLKAPIAANVLFELRRAAHGDPAALQRARFTLEKQRAILDPVWGGIYQYSAASDWNEPHFEKLITFQAPEIEAYARGYLATHDDSLLADALSLARYMTTFLSSPAGTFYVNQDADVNAHDHTKPFIDGHVYYALDDQHRRALGIPWIDTHVYARENGIALAALATLYEATQDPKILARARAAAQVLQGSHVLADGTVRREASTASGPYYLADAASLGMGFARLGEVSHDEGYRTLATRIGERLWATLHDASSGGLWDHTEDKDGVGVFAQRLQSVPANVSAARFFAALDRLTGQHVWRERGRAVLASVATPQKLDGEGSWLGDFLLAADDLGVALW